METSGSAHRVCVECTKRDFFRALQVVELDEGRFQIWKGSLALIQDHALFGIGLGNFEWRFPSYQPLSLARFWPHAHNDYLELLAVLGLPCFVLWIAAWAALIGRFKKNSWIQWGARISVFSFLIHGLADFNFAIPANAMTFIFIGAFLYHDPD